ncbi:hypothetical protein FB639_001930 [Coemansia asiatica]|nr:hypothetical protein FB639_001930 [Coemansia asiatica]
MALKIPCPRYDAHGVDCPQIPDGESWDWDQIEPIGREDKIITAHSGGHSEFSISYDNGKTFAVLQQNLKYMFFGSPSGLTNAPRKLKYQIKLPDNLPGSDSALFAWTWVNASGNREFYMNCVDVRIIGEAGEFTGKKMTIANYGPDYPSIPEFRGKYTTGINLYLNSRNITVSGPGNNATPDEEDTSTTDTETSQDEEGNSSGGDGNDDNGSDYDN